MTPAGKYNAIAGAIETGRTKNKETPFVRVKFRVTDGECKGDDVEWTGWLTEKAKPQAVKALNTAGWGGDWKDIVLPNPVEIVVEHEEYMGRVSARVRWVNALPSGAVTPAHSDEEAEDDIPF